MTIERKFVDTGAARILALLLALLFAFLLYYHYKDDFVRLASNEVAVGLPEATTASIADTNPELAQCLQKRIGDVNQMKQDGVLSEAQFSDFKARAEELCYQQNPAPQQ